MLDYARWVLVKRRNVGGVGPGNHVPVLPAALSADALGDACPIIDVEAWDDGLAGSERRFGDYFVGQQIDHVAGVTVEEAEHQMATRLYQNTAHLHFDGFSARDSRFGRRLIYGGHVISVARALSFNGLENAFHIAGINGGRHVAPLFSGDTIFACSEVLDMAELPGRDDVGALRLRMVATKDKPCGTFSLVNCEGAYDPAVVLDLDVWVFLPR